MGAQRSRRKNEKQAASAAKKRREPKPKRWPVGAALLDAVLNKKGKESSSAGPNPKALLNSLTRVAIALYTPVRRSDDYGQLSLVTAHYYLTLVCRFSCPENPK
jgi:hypothetical protein